jgi:hypothetical protein
MLCPSCGMKANDQDKFCTYCGKSLTGGQESLAIKTPETELYSFGPLWVNVCFSRPGTFVLMHKNDTKVVLTNRRIYGISTLGRDSLRFQVPYSSIIAKESYDYRLNFGLWRTLWIKYQESNQIKEVSILCISPNSHIIDRAIEILQKM